MSKPQYLASQKDTVHKKNDSTQEMMSTSHYNLVEERKSVNYAKFIAEMNERKSEKINKDTRDISADD